MEIKTCEEYVLAELDRARTENEALKDRLEESRAEWIGITDDLRKKLREYEWIVQLVQKYMFMNHSETGSQSHDRITLAISVRDDDPMFVPLHDLYIETGEKEDEQ